jgi:protein ImuB
MLRSNIMSAPEALHPSLWLASQLAHSAIRCVDTLFCMMRPLATAQHASPAPLRLSLRPAAGGVDIGFVKRRGPQRDTPLFIPLTPSSVLQRHASLDRPLPAPAPARSVFSEPVWRDEHLLRLLKERLGKLALEAPVIGLCLEALQVRAMAPPSASLFPEPGGTPEDRRRLFELLVARLGPENVLQAAPLADYRPELANAWVPLQQKIRPAAAAAHMPPDVLSLPRPVWMLAQALALPMREHRPFYGSPLKMVSSPERIEAGWWSAAQSRDYFIAEGQDHAYYWVYRERIAAVGERRDGAAEPRWYLHGLFG